jgi:hypothetical protein
MSHTYTLLMTKTRIRSKGLDSIILSNGQKNNILVKRVCSM